MVRVAKKQFREWLFSPLQSLWIIVTIFIYEFSKSALLQNASLMDGKIGLFEPFIAVANQRILQMIFPIVFVILLKNFPGQFCSSYYEILRMGRRRFLYTQLLFLLMCVVTFVFFVFVAATLPALGFVSLRNSFEWSSVVRDFKELKPEYSANPGTLLITESIFFQGKPFSVTMFSMSMLFLHLLSVGLILIASYSIMSFRGGMLIVFVFEIVGTAISYVDSWVRWVFPVAHSMFQIRYLKFFSGAEVALAFSYIYFLAIIVILTGISFENIKTMNLDYVGKDEE